MDNEIDTETVVQQRLDEIETRLRSEAEESVEAAQDREFDDRVEALYERLYREAKKSIREELEEAEAEISQ